MASPKTEVPRTFNIEFVVKVKHKVIGGQLSIMLNLMRQLICLSSSSSFECYKIKEGKHNVGLHFGANYIGL